MDNKLEIVRLEAAERPVFDCGSEDLNEFFHKDSIDWEKELISVTYAIKCKNYFSYYRFNRKRNTNYKRCQ